jgi:hypothetical protein
MKTLINSLIVTLFSICLITACDITESGHELQEDQTLNLIEMEHENNIKHFKKNRRAVPFKASFFTLMIINDEDPNDPEASGVGKDRCTEEPFIYFNVQEGYGQATHLGRFTTRMTFCTDITDLMDDGTLTGDESAPYNKGQGVLIAANGDELYFTIEGVVIPTDQPGYDFEFQDPFTFTGGTGRFAGVSGSGHTDSFHIQADMRTDHSWTGKLIFDRKK